MQKVKKAAPAIKEEVPRIKSDAAIGIMIHKDGTIEKRKF